MVSVPEVSVSSRVAARTCGECKKREARRRKLGGHARQA